MRDRNPDERRVLNAYLSRVRQVIQCVAEAEIWASRNPAGVEHNLTLTPRGSQVENVVPLRLNDGRRRLTLGIYQQFVIQDAIDLAGAFRVETRRYMYELRDRSDREIFSYHWHPEGASPIQFPHFHVDGAPPVMLTPMPDETQPYRLALDKAHFATGIITLEEVVALLIRDFDVQPRRTDWERVLSSG